MLCSASPRRSALGPLVAICRVRRDRDDALPPGSRARAGCVRVMDADPSAERYSSARRPIEIRDAQADVSARRSATPSLEHGLQYGASRLATSAFEYARGRSSRDRRPHRARKTTLVICCALYDRPGLTCSTRRPGVPRRRISISGGRLAGAVLFDGTIARTSATAARRERERSSPRARAHVDDSREPPEGYDGVGAGARGSRAGTQP